jgi:tetratricopeptide (TPR) repeat protein
LNTNIEKISDMKKILLALAMFAAIQVADAQVKSAADVKKSVEAAEAATQNVKKAVKTATWLKLGQEYVKAYDAPTGNILPGSNKTELTLMMGSEKPVSSEEVTVNNEKYTKDVYADKNLYFNQNGQLVIIEVTKPVYEDALERAVKAYQKAYELDEKHAKDKDVAAAFDYIGQKYVSEAFNKYTFGDVATASKLFEKAADVEALAPLSKIDTSVIYNAGFTAMAAKDNERALKFFKRCYDLGYYYEGGEVFARLAEVDTLNTKKYLEEGFSKFPQSQSILIGLINYYLKNNEDTETLFGLLDKAKANEPNNASLFYVEGNIRAQLGQIDKAVVAYEECAKINPEYEYGFIGEGTMFYNRAIELQTKAQEEIDDAKYMALVKEFEESLKSCIAPFEKAFEITKDANIKAGIASYLKNAFYRFREESAENQTKYEKYAEIAK